MDVLGENVVDKVIKKSMAYDALVDEFYDRGSSVGVFDRDLVKSMKGLLGGFAHADFDLALVCKDDCNGMDCSRPVIGNVTVLIGVVFWDRSKPWKRTASGLTKRGHEMVHFGHAKAYAEAADDLLHGLADGKCVSKACCSAKVFLLEQYVNLYKAEQDCEDSNFDLREYGGGGNVEAKRTTVLRMLVRVNLAESHMRASCEKR